MATVELGMRSRGPETGARATPDRVRRLVALGYGIALATVAVQSVAHVVGVKALDDRFTNLSADVEGTAFAWAGSASTFAAALVAFVLALVPERVDRRLLALSLILAAFSLDDAIALHERIAEAGVNALGLSDDAQRIVWPPVYLPLLGAALLLLLDTARRITVDAGRALRHGVALLVLAVAAELFGAFLTVVLDFEVGSWPDVVEVVVEEGAELGGWLLVAFALAAALLIEAERT